MYRVNEQTNPLFIEETANFASERGSKLRVKPLTIALLGDHSQHFSKEQFSLDAGDTTDSNFQSVMTDQIVLERVINKVPREPGIRRVSVTDIFAVAEVNHDLRGVQLPDNHFFASSAEWQTYCSSSQTESPSREYFGKG